MNQGLDEKNRLLLLLWFVGYCVEFPKRLVVRIGGHPEWNRHVLYRALQDGYLELYRSSFRDRELRSLRLTSKGVDYIADRDVDLLNQVLARMDSVTKSTRSTPEKILRLHSRATGLIMAKAAGAHFLPGEKPPLLMSEFRHHSSITPQQGEVYFYTPAEVRSAIEEYEPDTVAKTSRIIGILVRDDLVYFMYDSGYSRMYWLKSTEENAAVSIQTLLNSRGFAIQRRNQIVIGNNMSVPVKICRRRDGSKSRYFSLSDFFGSCYFVVNSREGDALLSTIINPDRGAKVAIRALEGTKPPLNPTREYDAVDIRENRPVILNYQCDLMALTSVNPAPYGFVSGPILLCLDYQVRALQEILGPMIEVRPMKGEFSL